MGLELEINSILLEMGTELSHQMLVDAAFQRTGLLKRLLQRHPAGLAVYNLDNCEFKGLDDSLHIYPCNHGYLNQDRRWSTRVTLFLKHDRLQRVHLQVIKGQTAAVNFLDRFTEAATARVGQPCHTSRYRTCWQGQGTRIEANLHTDHANADFDIKLNHNSRDHSHR